MERILYYVLYIAIQVLGLELINPAVTPERSEQQAAGRPKRPDGVTYLYSSDIV